ncbi:MAG: hypothetical protein IPK53_20610 [bacterium]|nr:hypothetical protein [bacterium]
MAPGSFFVLATDAYNHAGLDPASPNLSYANVETALPQEPFPPDNASVENMVDVMGIGFEWFFVRRWGQVLLTTGETWWARPCQPGEACGNLVCQVPLEEIVDGIEYLYALSGDSLPRLNNAIDAGIILGIEPWTGQSAERLTPGQDSDNSTDDFRVLALSTPGYQNALAVPQHPDPFVDTPLLLKAWPNPFNPELNVGLDVAERVVGRLAVFDVTGREVAVLHEDGWSPGAGNSAGGHRWRPAGPIGLFGRRQECEPSSSGAVSEVEVWISSICAKYSEHQCLQHPHGYAMKCVAFHRQAGEEIVGIAQERQSIC